MYPYFYIILPSYTLLVLIGAFCTMIFIYLRLDKFQMEFTDFLKLFLLCVIGGIVGSKLLFTITQIQRLIDNFSLRSMILLILRSGYVFYGGLFGVLSAIWIFTRNDLESRKRIFKMVTPGIPLFHAFGRIGCFLSGCCYGKKLAAPILIGDMVVLKTIPIQLFEAIFEFLLFAVLVILEKKMPDCDLLKLYLIVYAIFRFGNEFFRGDIVRGIYWGFSTAQWISIFIILFFVINFFIRRSLHKKTEID